MDKEYFSIKWSVQWKTGKNWEPNILVEYTNTVSVIAYVDTPEWRCLKKMLRKHPAIIVDQDHPWYDFVLILFQYIDQNSEV